jgi:tRNA-specific 2-thiouridylase
MRVLVAMSGGVDSSVVAALLHEQGHEVIGATLQLYDHGAAIQKKGACCAGQDIHDARRVADRLGFAHYVIDAEQRFRDAVIKPFADSYAAGETPVPCIACNQSVKFTDLVQLVDIARDQSWFLFATTAAQLERCLFPLGDFPTKADVRAEAARLGLEVAAKPDSQDICFVPQGSYADIVAKLRPDAMAQGDIVTAAGEIVGRHDGIANYTIGQAKRLGSAQVAGHRRVVVGLEPATRRVIVDTSPPGATTLALRDVNWLTTPGGRRCLVKLRSGEVAHEAEIRIEGGETLVELAIPARAAPGQACVFYEGTRVLGGGFIRMRMSDTLAAD